MSNKDEPAKPIELSGHGLCQPVAYTGFSKRELAAIEIAKGIYSGSSIYSLINHYCQDGTPVSTFVSRIALNTANKILEQE